MTTLAFFVLAAATGVAQVERPYGFRDRLVTVHRNDRRDFSVKAQADDFEFVNGVQIVLRGDMPELVGIAADDFREYLLVSMGINASVCKESDPERPGLKRALFVELSRTGKRSFSVDVRDDSVTLRATDAKMAAQGFYHLEDRMNCRKGPYLKKGSRVRTPMFTHRFTFSGYGNDLFPDAHLRQIAHHGFTGIEVWL